jgi:hypothetical protein
MNKIISMSVWGTDPRYITGAIRQISLAKKYYPEWTVRIYTDNPDNYQGVETVKICDSTYGMFWRFLPLFESDDNIVMVRDSDSRITIRESIAITEWLKSHEKFHVFRDHEAHYEFPIIGCAFALKGKLSKNAFEEMQKYQEVHRYLVDQFYLRDIVYPEIKNSLLVHSMLDGWFGETRKKLVNPYSFCGNGYDENDMPLYGVNLEECKNFNPSNLDLKYKFDEGLLNE